MMTRPSMEPLQQYRLSTWINLIICGGEECLFTAPTQFEGDWIQRHRRIQTPSELVLDHSDFSMPSSGLLCSLGYGLVVFCGGVDKCPTTLCFIYCNCSNGHGRTIIMIRLVCQTFRSNIPSLLIRRSMRQLNPYQYAMRLMGRITL